MKAPAVLIGFSVNLHESCILCGARRLRRRFAEKGLRPAVLVGLSVNLTEGALNPRVGPDSTLPQCHSRAGFAISPPMAR